MKNLWNETPTSGNAFNIRSQVLWSGNQWKLDESAIMVGSAGGESQWVVWFRFK